jgi:RNA recognition motif-containing protein
MGEQRKLIISKLPSWTTEDDLKDLFREYGVEAVILKPNKYAVVTFKNSSGAKQAKQEWSGGVWFGCWLRLRLAE